ncbi:hypothetical protein [Enterococcus sp. CWB-B31]|uniref:hypothetical protein n=1 Tax=Enterococcus sp. CWB-B31 TaxID=2885159 RepID=UPI001E5E347E|nr:hypothetical protein [Enterococcus sp. CWB-B31]MCB5954021.1 hypothetical protein [Enterococcus sp. CWB-B31]
MKKIGLFILAMVTVLSFAGCGSSEDKDGAAVSTKQSTEDKAANKTKKMEAMQKDLEEKGVNITYYDGYLRLTRERGIDYEYFQMTFKFGSKGLFEITLELKGNIDGEKKDLLYYEVSKSRIVESNLYNTDITKIAEVLESMDYSDKELLEFAQWYYENNK